MMSRLVRIYAVCKLDWFYVLVINELTDFLIQRWYLGMIFQIPAATDNTVSAQSSGAK